MPELPEVEVAAKNLRRWGRGHEIVSVDAAATRVLRPAAPRDLQPLVGATIREVRRVGKNLLLELARRGRPIGALSHLGMTGKWLRRDDDAPAPRHSRIRLFLDDGGVLHYCDQRMFGRFRVVPGARWDEVAELAALGPDPLTDGIDPKRLAAALARTRRPVKVALLDQALLPGVGNIQAGEALFRARIDPRRAANTITAAEARRIAAGVIASIHHTLDAFARLGQDSDRADIEYVEEGGENPFSVYDRAGETCPHCHHTRIERVVLGGRSTYFCPRCQR